MDRNSKIALLFIGAIVLLLVIMLFFFNTKQAPGTMTTPNARWAKCTSEMINDSQQIKGFCGPNAFLSNFYEFPVVRRGLNYLSSEAAYQAAKYDDRPEVQALFRNVTADESKQLVKRYPYNAAQFSKRRLTVMTEILVAKFSNPTLKRLLLATAPKKLVEYNWWGDTYWGVTKDGGENQLGLLLMELRRQLI
jgi:ribA/ribD-fused uncharacterized protein